MDILSFVLALVGAYLLGSIPSAVWIGRAFYGIDVRQHGSKNAGATNTFRVLGVKAGIPVLLIDAMKGTAACSLAYFVDGLIPETHEFINSQFLFGVAAVLGHVFPIFAGFKGGKGVATITGIVLAIAPIPTLVAMGVFVITLLISRYVSLSSILAGLSFPFLVIFVFKTPINSMIFFSILVSIVLLLTHRKNIERLIHKQENKANLFKKRKIE
jgi:acyl phosphate:glycerol-3-phosphate acyltransferase